MNGTAALDAAALGAAAEAVLRRYARHVHAGREPLDGFEDPGPLLVAALLSARPGAGAALDSGSPAAAAARTWLAASRGRAAHLGVSGRGLAGFVLALRQAATVWPMLRPLAVRARGQLVAQAELRPWHREPVSWPDYDLITGASGTLLTLAADPDCVPADCAATVAHLVGLSAAVGLPGLRLGRHRDDELIGWNYGRVNCGMGHGAPGVAAALCGAADAGALPPEGVEALRNVTSWLAGQSFVDARGVRTWPAGGFDAAGRPGAGAGAPHAARRQAWCYGTPGNSWTLWEAGRVLGDPGLTALAEQAAGSFIAAYDDDFYLDEDYPDRVGICHGAAGLLLIFDAFARYAGLPGAAALAEHLAGFLVARLDRIVAGQDADPTLLSGAGGVVAALLTYHGGGAGGRPWLAAFGLR
jgi:hypothetical protein